MTKSPKTNEYLEQLTEALVKWANARNQRMSEHKITTMAHIPRSERRWLRPKE